MTTIPRAVAPMATATSSRTRPRHTKPASFQRMAWSGVANVALALVLLLAGFGAFRAFAGELPFGGSNGPGADNGNAAYAQLATLPAATAEPENASTACVFSESVPIYSGVDSPPVDGTVLYTTSSGDLTLTCPDEPQPIVLSHTVAMASATNAPGVVQIQIPNGTTTDVVMMNVMTREWIQLNPGTFSSYLGDANMGGALQIFPVVGSPDAWSLLNLETMQSATLADLTGAKFPASAHITVATAANNAGIAVSLSQYRTEGSATLAPAYGAEGDVAVIGDDLETVHWVSVPADFPEVTNISLSPDASQLALVSNLTSYEEPTANTTISVIEVATGEEIVRSDPFIAPAGAFFQWAENGNAITYITDSTAYRLELEPDAIATELYASDGTLMLMPATTQSNLLHLKEQTSDGNANLVILETDTGDVVTVAGDPWFRGTTPVMHWTDQLHPIVVVTSDGWNIVDPRTGESLMTPAGSADTSPVTQDEDGQMRLRQLDIVAQQAPVSAVMLEDSTIATFELRGAEPTIAAWPAPPEDASGQIRISPDGSALIAGQGTWEGEEGPWWSLDLTNPDAEWTPGPDGSRITWLAPTTAP